MRNSYRIPCTGTKYFKVCVSSNEEMLMCITSTPLTKDELIAFLERRIGYVPVIKVHEAPISEVKGDLYGKIVGLSTLEELLEPFVPEKILEEKTIKLVKTNKTHGDYRVESIEEKEA